MTYYTYYSYEEWGRGYIGHRKCPTGKNPETDEYLGSFTDKTFKPTAKEILGIYDSREKALQAEIILHGFFDVARNPHFANKACATSTGFCCDHTGKKLSEEHRKKLSKIRKGRNISEEHRKKLSEAKKGKSFSEEHRKKLSEANRGKICSSTTRRKLSKANKGKIRSRETREKMSKLLDWYHPTCGTVLQTSAAELVRLFPDQNLFRGHLSSVALGKRHQHKGWRSKSVESTKA